MHHLYRYSGYFMLLLIFSSCSLDHRPTQEVLRSNVETIQYVIDGDIHDGWRIAPEISPDRLPVECEQEVEVKFITDIDSIAFKVKEGDTIQFYVLWNGRDSALTEIVGVPKNVHFSDEYIAAHQGKLEVEIPEVHELANIMVALSDIGQQDSNMVDMTTNYYQEMMAHFSPFADHPAIDTMNNNITGVFDNDSYYYYYSLKMNACGYLFDSEGKIVDDGIIHFMGFQGFADPFLTNTPLFEDFARQSNFRDFYQTHQSYYDSLLTIYRQLNPIDQMQNWLEDKFNMKYGNYRVTFSPLVGGAHSTQRFSDNGFKQTVMFVCRAEPSPRYNAAVNEMRDSRVVFTEIDHNFVNPISDQYAAQIDLAMEDRSKWVKEDAASAYSSPYAVFNEYMTWAVFSMYCIDYFEEEDVAQFIDQMEDQMVDSRGFKNFAAFNQHLISLYEPNRDLPIQTLYEEMLAWCEGQ